MRYSKKISVIILLLLLITSCKVYDIPNQHRTLKIKEESDSSDAGLCQLFIFKKGEQVIDTIANFEGEFNILLSNKIKKILFRTAGDDLLEMKRKDLLTVPIIYMKENEFLINTGGVESDDESMKANEKLMVDMLKWNHKIGIDSISYGGNHPDEPYYYRELNFLKTKFKW